MVVLGVLGKYHCVCVVVIDLRCTLDLLWDYPEPEKLNLLNVLLDSTYYSSYLSATGVNN